MDWVAFLEDNSINYVTRGPNTKRGEVSIQCPWCGADDPSEHLGISLTSQNWGCLRDQAHRGHAPHNLIQAILGCSFGQARLIAGQYSKPDPDGLDDTLAALQATQQAPKGQSGGVLTLPPDFRAIRGRGVTMKYWMYLESRGFDETEIDLLVHSYQLMCCTTGEWKDRVIIPIYHGEQLLGWTGRALQARPQNAPRYLSNSGAVKETVYLPDGLLLGDDLLFVVEGPLDALKMDFYGRELGARTTCLFGTSVTEAQIALLNELAPRFHKVVILLDPDALASAFSLSDWLQTHGAIIGSVPDGVEDPGAMTKREVQDYVRQIRREP